MSIAKEIQKLAATRAGLPVVVVTRHNGAIEWLKQQPGFETSAAASVAHLGAIQTATHYVGILPTNLVAEIWEKGGMHTALSLPDLPAEWRGKELSAEEMRYAGARLDVYYAFKV